MYADPWDLKHEIQEIQEQQQRYNKKLLPNGGHSSSAYKDSSSILEDNLPSQSVKSNEELQQKHHNSHLLKEQQDEANNYPIENTTDSRKPNKSLYEKSLNSSYQQEDLSTANDVQFIEKPNIKKERKKFGNLTVFIETKNFILSIGPNYLFFLLAYSSFTAASIYLVYLVNGTLENIPFKICNFLFCLIQNLSYLMVALSNPGVKLPTQDIIMSSEKQDSRYCKKCGAIQQRKTYHCRECDICVEDYDHHCPWTSKCIGGGNLKRFYFFVGITPFYIFYYVVVFMICMATLTVPHAKGLKPQLPMPST